MKKLKHFPCLQILLVTFEHIQEWSRFFLALRPLVFWPPWLSLSYSASFFPSMLLSLSLGLGTLRKLTLTSRDSLALFLSNTPLQKPLSSEFSGRLNQTAAQHLDNGIAFKKILF